MSYLTDRIRRTECFNQSCHFDPVTNEYILNGQNVDYQCRRASFCSRSMGNKFMVCGRRPKQFAESRKRSTPGRSSSTVLLRRVGTAECASGKRSFDLHACLNAVGRARYGNGGCKHSIDIANQIIPVKGTVQASYFCLWRNSSLSRLKWPGRRTSESANVYRVSDP